MRVLAVTNMYPTRGDPVYGSFVARQMASVKAAGAHVDVLFVDGRRGMWRYPAAIWRVARALRRGRIDVVHAHYGLTGFFASFHQRPLVVSYCGDDLLGTPNGRGGTTFKSRVTQYLSQLAASRADGIICKSEALRQELRADPDRNRAHVIGNGVPTDLFHPGSRSDARSQLGLPLDERLVLFPHSRSQAAVKRFALAEQAIARLREMGLTARLWIVNGVPPDDMPAYYRAADCLLVTSAHEGGPNVVKEALCCDLPVVSTDVGDVRMWTERTGGCRIVSDSATNIATALKELLTGRSAVNGAAVRALLSMDAVASRILEVYVEAVTQRKRLGLVATRLLQ